MAVKSLCRISQKEPHHFKFFVRYEEKYKEKREFFGQIAFTFGQCCAIIDAEVANLDKNLLILYKKSE
jgi:hypothetical protein